LKKSSLKTSILLVAHISPKLQNLLLFFVTIEAKIR